MHKNINYTNQYCHYNEHIRNMKMIKKLSAMKARQNFGWIMNEVSLKGDDYIIERAGKQLVAIISMEKLSLRNILSLSFKGDTPSMLRYSE